MIDTLNISELSDEVKKLKDNVSSIVPVPEPETTDAGKIIGVNEDGEYELVDAPAGGGSYTLIAEYEDQYGESTSVGAIFEAFIAKVNSSIDPPTSSDFVNYKFTIGGTECRILSFTNLVSGAVASIILAQDECNKTNGAYDGTYSTTTFYYTDNGAGTKTSAVKKVSYKTSGITVSDINSYAMMFMGTKFRCYKLG